MLNFGEKKIAIYATTKLNILNETKNHNPPPPPPRPLQVKWSVP